MSRRLLAQLVTLTLALGALVIVPTVALAGDPCVHRFDNRPAPSAGATSQVVLGECVFTPTVNSVAYSCMLHPGMSGAIVVGGASEGAAAADDVSAASSTDAADAGDRSSDGGANVAAAGIAAGAGGLGLGLLLAGLVRRRRPAAQGRPGAKGSRSSPSADVPTPCHSALGHAGAHARLAIQSA